MVVYITRIFWQIPRVNIGEIKRYMFRFMIGQDPEDGDLRGSFSYSGDWRDGIL